MGGETHNGVEGALDFGNADVADPFLDAVGAGFVEGLVILYVIVDFGVGEGSEGYLGGIGGRFHALGIAYAYGGGNLVGFAGKEMQHLTRLVRAGRLAHDAALADYEGVGSDKYFVVGKRTVKTVGFAYGKGQGNHLGVHVGAPEVLLKVTVGIYLKINT